MNAQNKAAVARIDAALDRYRHALHALHRARHDIGEHLVFSAKALATVNHAIKELNGVIVYYRAAKAEMERGE